MGPLLYYLDSKSGSLDLHRIQPYICFEVLEAAHPSLLTPCQCVCGLCFFLASWGFPRK